MSRVLLIADTHFGHMGISKKFREGFPSDHHHDNWIAQNILRSLKKRDVLWLLGDCFFTYESLKFLNQFADRCQAVNMVLGNHDTDKDVRMDNLPFIFDACNKVGSMFRYKGSWLTHHPMHPQELYGKINVHGHVHSGTIPDERYVNVSCENTGYYPINYQDILKGWRGE